MEESRTSQFSLCGNFFAHANHNGVLKVWDTQSGKLHQDYTPSSHLASLGSCLQWAPFKMRQGGGGGGTKKKKKQKIDSASSATTPSAETTAVESLHLVAWGTDSGHILLYSFAKGELHNRLVGGHSNARVNDLCWSTDGTKLFSCGEDRQLAEWDVVAGKLTESWKADHRAAKSISISADGAFLISASRKIKFWDAKSHRLLQIFTGHATPVDTLLFIHPPTVENKGNLASRPYFISAARDDRVINIWQYNPDAGAISSANHDAGAISSAKPNSKTTTTTSALVSMTIPEEPQQLSLKQPESIGEPILLSVVSKAGVLYVFQHRLNGPMQKPLNPKVTINITDSKESCSSLSVLNSLIRVDKEVLFCFGSFMSPSFEHAPYDPSTPILSLQRSVTTTMTTMKSKAAIAADSVVTSGGGVVEKTAAIGGEMGVEKIKVLGPGNLASSKSSKRKESTPVAATAAAAVSAATESSPINRKRKLSEKVDSSAAASDVVVPAASFGEILAASNQTASSSKISSSSSSSTPVSSQLGLLPKPKEKTILLTQGLVSRDTSIVNNVLQESNDVVIRNTVKSLAIDYVQPLLDVLSPRLGGHSKTATNAAKWLKWILKLHAGFLLSHGHLLDKMEKMRRAMEARAETLDRAARLQGRLELVLTQVKLRKETRELKEDAVTTTTTTVGGANPLYTYEEDSDNDDDNDDELMKSIKDSDSEDEDAAMGEWINISAPGSPSRAEVVAQEEEEEEGEKMEDEEGVEKEKDSRAEEGRDAENVDNNCEEGEG